MKTTFMITALSGCLLWTAIGAEVRLEDCPPAVQSTIRENSRSGKIDEIESFAIQGKTLYVAEVELGGDRDLKIHVASDGALVKTREDFPYAEVPDAVRKTVESKLGGGTADDVDKEISGNTVTYFVEIDRSGAPDVDLAIDAEGKLLSETEDAGD